LNRRCPIAVRLAATLPLIDARRGVMVVPIFEPSTRAQARSKVIHPLLHMIRVMANMAADDWIIMVTSIPTRQKIRTEPKPIEA
jgi:hypothetical protein